MLSPVEVGWRLAPYALGWLTERSRLAAALALEVAEEPTEPRVHDLRVACRRLREAIAFFHGAPEVPLLSEVDRAARRLAQALRHLRETDAAKARLDELDLAESKRGVALGHPRKGMIKARDALVRRLERRRHRIRRKSVERIRRRATRLVLTIQEHRHRPGRFAAGSGDDRWKSAMGNTSGEPETVAAMREAGLRAFVESRLASRRAELERRFRSRRGARDKGSAQRDDEYLHGMRLAVKHWRYALEIARATMPLADYHPVAAQLRALQEAGGKSQDLADLVRILEREVSRKSKKQRRLLALARAARVRQDREFLRVLAPPGLPAAAAPRPLVAARRALLS